MKSSKDKTTHRTLLVLTGPRGGPASTPLRSAPAQATTIFYGPLDELLALHDELGILVALDGQEVQR